MLIIINWNADSTPIQIIFYLLPLSEVNDFVSISFPNDSFNGYWSGYSSSCYGFKLYWLWGNGGLICFGYFSTGVGILNEELRTWSILRCCVPSDDCILRIELCDSVREAFSSCFDVIWLLILASLNDYFMISWTVGSSLMSWAVFFFCYVGVAYG